MRITLYQNCILTDAYSEVFDVFLKDNNNKTALERYLETLPNTTYEVVDVFITNAGKFTFVAGDNASFYNFNYMKVEDTDNNITRYAFIETITIVNGLAVVNYIEDTWSNYASSMKIRNSLLTRSRIIDYGQTIYGRIKIPFYAIDYPYNSNERPKFTCLNNGKVIGEDAEIKDCNLVVNIQLFKKAQSGEVSDRQTYTALLKCAINDETLASLNADYKAGVWVNIVQQMVIQSSSLTIKLGGTEDYNYEITKVFVIPGEFNLKSKANSNSKFTLSIPASSTSDLFIINFYELFTYGANIYNNNNSGELIELCNYGLNNSFKRIGVGTLSQPITTTNNGTTLDVFIYYTADAFNFKLFIGLQSKIIEITDSFELSIPISVMSADVAQQQRTARAVETLNGVMQMGNGLFSIAGGAQTMGPANMLLESGLSKGQLGTILSGTNFVQGSQSSIMGGVSSVVRGVANIAVANMPMFVSNRGISVQSNAVLNASYGIISGEVVADNEAQVVRYTNESGYACNEIVDTKIFTDIQTGLENKYNVVMFDYVKLYGKFSQRIASVLREILTNGVKIWYDETAINE